MTEARIHERGYLPYNGPRNGPAYAMVDTGRHTVQRVLGMKRTIWQKVLPIFTLLVAFVPAIVFIGFAAFTPSDSVLDLIEAPVYYEIIAFALVLFAAFVAPEAVCTDRRSGMLGLYMASPLNRDTYLLAKFAAVTAVMGIMTVGPSLLMLIAYALGDARPDAIEIYSDGAFQLSGQGYGPDGVDGWLVELGRILASGLAMAAFWAALSLAVSSLTSRRARASVAIFLGVVVSAIVAGALAEGLEVGDGFALLDMYSLPNEAVYRIYGEVSDADTITTELDTWAVVLALVGCTSVFAGFARWRYQRIEIAG